LKGGEIMELESLTRIASTGIAGFVTYRGYTAYSSSSGKTKAALGFITWSMLALTVVEGLALFGFDSSLGALMPVYWSSDILNSLLLLGAIAALGKK